MFYPLLFQNRLLPDGRARKVRPDILSRTNRHPRQSYRPSMTSMNTPGAIAGPTAPVWRLIPPTQPLSRIHFPSLPPLLPPIILTYKNLTTKLFTLTAPSTNLAFCAKSTKSKPRAAGTYTRTISVMYATSHSVRGVVVFTHTIKTSFLLKMHRLRGPKRRSLKQKKNWELMLVNDLV